MAIRLIFFPLKEIAFGLHTGLNFRPQDKMAARSWSVSFFKCIINAAYLWTLKHTWIMSIDHGCLIALEKVNRDWHAQNEQESKLEKNCF